MVLGVASLFLAVATLTRHHIAAPCNYTALGLGVLGQLIFIPN